MSLVGRVVSNEAAPLPMHVRRNGRLGLTISSDGNGMAAEYKSSVYKDYERWGSLG